MPEVLLYYGTVVSRSGGTGRRTGLKILRGLNFVPVRFRSPAPNVFSKLNIAGWSSLVARRAHNPKVVGSNPAPAPKKMSWTLVRDIFCCARDRNCVHDSLRVFEPDEGRIICFRADRFRWKREGGEKGAEVKMSMCALAHIKTFWAPQPERSKVSNPAPAPRKKTSNGCLFSVIFAYGKLYCYAVIFGLRQVVLCFAQLLANIISLKP